MREESRQGDVLLRPVIKKMKGEKIGENKYTVAYGEKTGHSHVLRGDFQVFKEKAGIFVVVGRQGAMLQHEFPDGSWTREHHPINVDMGMYEVVQQREYTLLDEIRSVRD